MSKFNVTMTKAITVRQTYAGVEADSQEAAEALAQTLAVDPAAMLILPGPAVYVSTDMVQLIPPVVETEEQRIAGLKQFNINSLPRPFNVWLPGDELLNANKGLYTIGETMRAFAVDQTHCSKVEADLFAALDAYLITQGAVDGEQVHIV